MKIFNATLDFIVPVLRDAKIEKWEPLYQETQESITCFLALKSGNT